MYYIIQENVFREKHYDDLIDSSAYDFCNETIKLFELNDAFVMDLALTDDDY